MEDARFVRFTDDDGDATYYATYTAFDGFEIIPQLIQTDDFVSFRISTLNGPAAQNKGMALFPRRISGKYVMLSRRDRENLHLATSTDVQHWADVTELHRPSRPWELLQIGNCGSPLETDAGWLVITHGVGPMRRYVLGALLLDLDDPRRVVGQLREPLLGPDDAEREGYVPNVVYSCGSMLNGHDLHPALRNVRRRRGDRRHLGARPAGGAANGRWTCSILHSQRSVVDVRVLRPDVDESLHNRLCKVCTGSALPTR